MSTKRVQAVLVALRDRAVALPDAVTSSPAAARMVVEARERAADEGREHEVLGPPLGLEHERVAAERAACRPARLHHDVELERLRSRRHRAGETSRAVREVA